MISFEELARAINILRNAPVEPDIYIGMTNDERHESLRLLKNADNPWNPRCVICKMPNNTYSYSSRIGL